MSFQQPPHNKSNAGLWLGGAATLLVAVIMGILLDKTRGSRVELRDLCRL